MFDLLNRFSLDAATFNQQVLICALLVWLVVAACGVSSVLTRGYDRKQRVVWSLVILFVPVLGLLAYLPFSVREEDLPGQLFWKK